MIAKKRVLLIVSALLLAGLAAFVALRFEATADIIDFLPPPAEPELAELTQRVTRSPFSRSMVLDLSGTDSERLRSAARELSGYLRRADQGVEWLDSGPEAQVAEHLYGLLFPRRFGFWSEDPEAELPSRFTDEGLASAASQLRKELSSLAGPLIRPFAARDPYLIFPERLRQLEASKPEGVTDQDGVFVSRDGQHAFLFLGTEASAFDVPTQSAFLEGLDQEVSRISERLGSGLTLEASGVNRFAVRLQQSMQADILRISILSTLAILVMAIGLFRSVRVLLLVYLPLFVGLLAAVAACLVLFGRVHALTLAFGATLLGVCVDYPIHFFDQHLLYPSPEGARGSLRQVWNGILLGALTTALGFASLALSGYPGILQVAVFSIVGVLAALAVTRVLLPAVTPAASPRPPALVAMAGAAGRASVWAKGRSELWLLLAPAIILAAFGLPRLLWSDSLAALTVVDHDLVEQDEAVRARISGFDSGRFVIAVGPNEEAALRVNDEVAKRLAAAKANGDIQAYRSLHSLLWSKDLQQRNLDQLKRAAGIGPRLVAALQEHGFRPESFQELVEELDGPQPAPLGLEELLSTAAAGLARPFVFRTEEAVHVLSFLRGVTRPEALRQRLGGLEGAFYFDQKELLDQGYSKYRERALLLILIGALAVTALVAARYRRFSRVLTVCLPAFAACVATLGLLGLLAVPVSLMHVFALLLVFCMGTDYGIFLTEAVAKREDGSVAVLSICLSAIFTTLAFGLLAMSSSPALQAIGFATTFGVFLSLIHSLALCLPYLARRS